MKLILWDFDGTLTYREGMWTGSLIEVLRAEAPEIHMTRDDVRPYLQQGFPWHTPDISHIEIRSGDDWWEKLNPVFERAFIGVGVSGKRAKELSRCVRTTFCDPTRWHLFDDALPALRELTDKGWFHRILSNHVPELPSIVEYLGLMGFIQRIHNSAETGFEIPNPEAFLKVRRSLPAQTEIWMVGDSATVDVLGAEEVGIPAILVRRPDPRVQRYCERLEDLFEIIESS
jgi:putative hydrolase of the HAD superfamily